jgi:antitoxin ParD1/3/4
MDIRSASELVLGLELCNVGNYSGRDSMLNISLPTQITDFIEKQAIADGFNTPSEYVLNIIVRERERLERQQRVESLLIEGLDSGVPTEITDDLMRHRLRELVEEGAIVHAARDLSLVQEWM